MKGKTHAGIGVSVFVYLCNLLPGKFKIINLVFAILGSILPDIDHPKSFVNKYLLPFRNQATKVTFFCSLGILMLYLDNLYKSTSLLKIFGISLILIGCSTHRMGLTHSILGLVLFTSVLAFFAKVYNLLFVEVYFFSGFLFHLLCDMLTKRGVPLLYPFKSEKYRVPITYSTGSYIGNIIEGAIIVMSITYTVYTLPKLL